MMSIDIQIAIWLAGRSLGRARSLGCRAASSSRAGHSLAGSERLDVVRPHPSGPSGGARDAWPIDSRSASSRSRSGRCSGGSGGRPARSSSARRWTLRMMAARRCGHHFERFPLLVGARWGTSGGSAGSGDGPPAASARKCVSSIGVLDVLADAGQMCESLQNVHF